jgi:hypothetical protein
VKIERVGVYCGILQGTTFPRQRAFENNRRGGDMKAVNVLVGADGDPSLLTGVMHGRPSSLLMADIDRMCMRTAKRADCILV